MWVYTTSYRSPIKTKLMFRAYGAKIDRVVNQHEHERMIVTLGENYRRCTKFPPAFGIDLLVDECGGVLLEAQEFGFEVVRVLPDDDDWDKKVRSAVQDG